MGFALAEAAAARGAEVTLVAGPSNATTPIGVTRIDVRTAAEMAESVAGNADADVIIMAAAVADYRPATSSDSKIKKKDEALVLALEPTTDILKSLGKTRKEGQILVGFAMETDNVDANARRKLEEKRLDWIIVNDLRETGAGFGPDTNRVTVIGANGRREELPILDKRVLANRLLELLFPV